MGFRRTTQLGLAFAAMVLAWGLTARAAAPGPAYELCLEQSPAQAGKLSPDPGSHRFSADSIVVVSAEPQPGYQFAYWLGDVADPKAQRTTVQLDASKIVVAVFQPAPRDYPQEVLLGGGGGGARGAAAATPLDLSMPGYSLAGGGGPAKSDVVLVPVPPNPPVPEPATILLFGLGALVLRRTRLRTVSCCPTRKSPGRR